MRDWLSKNKIIFETIAATLLSLMALCVSWLTYRISARQTELTRLQTNIAHQQEMPQFIVQRLYVRSPDGIFHDVRVTVQNKGPIARAAEVDNVDFITLRCSGFGRVSRSFRLPIINYLDSNFVTSGQDLEFSLERKGNNDEYAKIYTGLMEIDGKRNTLVEVGITSYIRVNYQDLFGDKHSDYFWIRGRTAAEQVSQAEGEAAFQEHKEGSTKELLIFPKLTAEQLHQKCAQ